MIAIDELKMCVRRLRRLRPLGVVWGQVDGSFCEAEEKLSINIDVALSDPDFEGVFSDQSPIFRESIVMESGEMLKRARNFADVDRIIRRRIDAAFLNIRRWIRKKK